MKKKLQKQKTSHRESGVFGMGVGKRDFTHDTRAANLDYAAAAVGLAEAASQHGRSRQRFKRVMALGLAAFAFVGGAFAVSGQQTVQAAACPAPTADLGTDTMTINVDEANTYTVWVRMVAPDAANNSINLQIDEATCFNVGGGTFQATTWADSAVNWVNYADGVPSAVMRTQLTAGAHTVKLIGTKPGVQVDKIIVTTNDKLVPSGVCNDCMVGDSTPPTVNMTPPQQTTNVLGPLTLQATAADASGVAKVDFLLDDEIVYTDTTAPYSFDFHTPAVQNGTHQLKVQATDVEGNTAVTTPVTITTNNIVVCTGKPTAPTNLRVSGVSGTTVALAWDASTPGAECRLKSYRIFRDGAQVATAQGTTFTDTGLAPGSAHNYTVVAVDLSNNVSDQSASATGTTASDVIAPTVPTGLRTALVTADSVSLAWNASTDNSAVAAYVIYRNGAEIGTSNTPSYTDSAVESNKDYTYTVAAKDSANNLSAQSQAIAAKTLAKPQPQAPAPSAPTPSKPTPSVNRPSTSSPGARPSTSTSTSPQSTTTVAPLGNSQPVTLPNETEVELSDPVVVQTTPDSSQATQKVEYYLNGKLIATVKQPPYTYSVDTKNLKNGTYTLTTKTYYENGEVETKNASLVVKNPMSFRQIMLQLGALVWVIIFLLVAAAGVVWYFYFRNRDNGDDYTDTDGYMFGPTGQMGGPSGGNYGPPAQYSKLLSQFRPILAYDTVELNRY